MSSQRERDRETKESILAQRKPSSILPGSTIGIFGSGQLGRMLAIAAREMGYRVATFSPEKNSPTGQIADQEISAPYDDLATVRSFVRGVDVVTFEFENVAATVAQTAAAEGIPVRPGGHVLHTAQNRLREKTFLAEQGLPVTPFRAVRTVAELTRAVDDLGTPAVLKTAAFGYDGKGQAKISAATDIESAWQAIGEQEAILEAFVPFAKEVSVVAARGVDGSFTHHGVIENMHTNHILDLSIAPARVSGQVMADAVELAHAVLTQLDVVGVLCIEFFLQENDTLLINELAPRPHNSGHLTIDAAVTSQFEQQLRAICGLPLGSTELLRPAAMANLLGDLWANGEPNWAAACALPSVKLHLYGKAAARPGRKMGHITALGSTVDEAIALARQARDLLTP
ncbi:MAG: 5-(carboxyamino)imidazole ribonucleotide synthase [Caldilineaceae bacterium]